jgi:hypothetical protein
MSTRLETVRLVIRTFESRDGQAWVAMLSDPEVLRFLPPGPAPAPAAGDSRREFDLAYHFTRRW